MKKVIILLIIVWQITLISAKEIIIRVGLDNNYPPYEFVDKSGNAQGFNIDLLREIEKDSDFRFEFYPSSWDEVLRKVNNNEVDILSGMFFSENRAKEFFFSMPHSYVSYVIFSHKDKMKIETDNLSNKKILVQKNDIMHSMLQKDSSIFLIPVADPEEAILRLRFEDYDGAAISLVAGNYFVRKHNLNHITHNPRPLLTLTYCFAGKYNNSHIIGELSEKLSILIHSGRYHKIQQKWFADANLFSQYKWVFISLIALIILLSLSLVVWFFISKNKIKKTREELNSERIFNKALKSRFEHNSLLYDKLISILNEGIWEWDYRTGQAIFSPTYYTMLGYENNEFEPSFDSWKELLHPEERETVINTILNTLKIGKQTFEVIFRLKKKDSSYIWVLGRGVVTEYDDNKNPVCLVGIHSDITLQKRREEQLYHAQKMEAIGRLSSVIAHDFNNLLTAILGNVDIALLRYNNRQEVIDRLNIVRETCSKAKLITRRLLMMSKKQESLPNPVNVCENIKEILEVIKRLMGEDIQVELKCSHDELKIYIDPFNFEQTIINLCSNAKEAMLNGGKLIIQVERKFIDETYLKFHPKLFSGNYVLISISDNGCGISEENCQKIFEPFFTTKKTNTGLGLSLVYTTINQAKGDILVYSELNVGTTFKILLPEHINENNRIIFSEDFSRNNMNDSFKKLPIVVIEDDSVILNFIQESLQEKGFTVIIFKTGNEFVEYMLNNSIKILLLLIDIILPDIRGYRIKDLVSEYIENTPIVYMSGYPKELILKENKLIENESLLLKPFSPNDLYKIINEKLNLLD